MSQLLYTRTLITRIRWDRSTSFSNLLSVTDSIFNINWILILNIEPRLLPCLLLRPIDSGGTFLWHLLNADSSPVYFSGLLIRAEPSFGLYWTPTPPLSTSRAYWFRQNLLLAFIERRLLPFLLLGPIDSGRIFLWPCFLKYILRSIPIFVLFQTNHSLWRGPDLT